MTHVAAVRLKAFKSVGDEWQEFSFERGLNAIVGPNGCGKSSLLDALCFAFAAPARSFAAASLADLANSDSSEVCEVAVQLHSGSGMHTVAAALTPDGGRAFKVNGRRALGRVKSGKEVREFLRGLGVCLESSVAVVKQAQVTRLADSNRPADLAALVAEASGLGRWNEEVAAATEELKRTRKALADVQADLLTLERSVAADEGKLAALDRLAQIEHEAAALAQQMAGHLQAAMDACAAVAADGAAGSEAAATSVSAAQQEVERLQGELEAARRQLAAAQQQQERPEGTGASLLALQQQAAEAEEEVRLLTERRERRQQLQAEVEEQRAAVAALTASREAAAAQVTASRQAQAEVASHLQRAESAASAEALQASVAADVGRLEAAVEAKEQAAAAAAAAAEETSGLLAELQAEQRRATAALAASQQGSDASSSHGEQCAALQAEVQQHRSRLQQLRQAEQRLQLEAGTLGARLGGSAASAWRPLHQCYRFRDPQGCQAHAAALQVLAGGKQGVLVADSLAAAGELLAGVGGARIWPLDGLVAPDHSRQQRRAAQAFPAGQVVLPVDLLAFEERFRPAVLRAFGSHLLAADDAVAEALATRFGLPSITPDGKTTARGSLQARCCGGELGGRGPGLGGWRGAGGDSAAAPMRLKLSLDAAEQQLGGVRQQAAAAQAALEAAQQQLLQAEERQAALDAAAAELAEAQRELQAAQARLSGQQALQAEAQAALEQASTDLAAKRQLRQAMAGSGGGSGGSQGAAAALRKEQQRLAAAAAAHEARLSAAAAELAGAAARLAATEGELALALPEGWAEQLEGRRREHGAAAAALLARQAELALASAEVAAQQHAVEAAAGRLAAAQEALAAAEEAAASQQSAAQQAAEEQGEVRRQLAALVREVPELEGAAAASTGSQEAGASAAALRKAAAQLGRQRGKLLEERRRSAAAAVPLAEQVRFREQRAGLEAARRQAGTLQTAVQRLQEGIAGSNEQVLATNEAVFAAIAATFQSLVAAVLPAYRVRLRKVGEAVHEGVQLEFAHRGGGSQADSEEGGDGGGGAWRAGLDVLSGGQRTLVSLTFLVAVAMAGAATSVFLMDEVDAALDETNQHLVARLFDSLCGCASAACTQVLCVSHNAAFQKLCSRVVRLTRGAGGTVPAGGGDKAAAAGERRGKKARSEA